MNEAEIKVALKHMEEDPAMKTALDYSTDDQQTVKVRTFGEKHGTYLREHPKINPQHYLSNLRAMIKIRP